MADDRNMSDEYTTAELDEVRKLFCGLQTYRSEDDSIATADITAFVTGMRWGKTEDQIQAYIDHWDRHWGGRAPWDVVLSYVKTVHKTSLLIHAYVETIDKDNSGTISSTEFKDVLKLTKKHDPNFPDMSYDQFLEEADVNHDGTVSREECEKWLNTQLER